jgi:putative membrane protein
MIVEWLSFFFFAVAGLVHVGFFVLESILFQRPGGHKLFRMTEADHAAAKVWAKNQGFYNLFLAIGTFIGLGYVLKLKIEVAGVLTGFCGFSMIAAGVVLWVTSPQLRRGALLQIVPPVLGFVFLAFHIASHF